MNSRLMEDMLQPHACFLAIDPNAATSAGLEAIPGTSSHYEHSFTHRMLRIHLIMSYKAFGTLRALCKRRERNHVKPRSLH